MNFIVNIDVMPHKELLDPQGKAVSLGLKGLGLESINDVRIGKHIQFKIEADSEASAMSMAEQACKELLVNPIMESYDILLKEC
jgi:phosphoribosylformylglycinamidine synthase subunit PurS